MLNISLLLPTPSNLWDILKCSLFWLVSDKLISQVAVHSSEIQSEQKLLVCMKTQKAQIYIYSGARKKNSTKMSFVQFRRQILIEVL